VDQRRLVERARGGDHDAFAELARAAVVRLDQTARLILRDPERANWSPDGMRIVYWSWNPDADSLTARSRVVGADGTGDQPLPEAQGEVWNAQSLWSNDGARLFLLRGYTSEFADVRGFVLPADGSSVGIEVAPAGTLVTGCCAAWMWSPDDSQILGRLAGPDGSPLQQLIIDVATRQVRSAPWPSTSDPAWQRLAQ
jgi:hypothetical protein